MKMTKAHGLILVLMILLAGSLMLSGCEEDNTPPPGKGAQGTGIKEESDGSLKITATLYRYGEGGTLSKAEDVNGTIFAAFAEGDEHEGTVTNGVINLTVPKPKATSLELVKESLPAEDGVVYSVEDAKIVSPHFYTTDSPAIQYGYTSADSTHQEMVMYVYADKAVDITGSVVEENGITGSLDMRLNAGWNTVIMAQDLKRETGEDEWSGTGSYKTANPSDDCKWIIW
jgi:hypothetical protein